MEVTGRGVDVVVNGDGGAGVGGRAVAPGASVVTGDGGLGVPKGEEVVVVVAGVVAPGEGGDGVPTAVDGVSRKNTPNVVLHPRLTTSALATTSTREPTAT